MPSVYLVTSGTYSDYTVHAAFSTREKAERYIAREFLLDKWADLGIETYELDEPDPYDRYEQQHAVHVRAHVSGVDRLPEAFYTRKPPALYPVGPSAVLTEKVYDSFAEALIVDPDPERAVKIALDWLTPHAARFGAEITDGRPPRPNVYNSTTDRIVNSTYESIFISTDDDT